MGSSVARRTRGQRAGLSVEQILSTARRMDPTTLSMLGLAKELGVDRKALNHHVAGREHLLALVAGQEFTDLFAVTDGANTWQETCVAFGHAVARSAIELGPLIDHLHLPDLIAENVLTATDIVMACLTQAGFDDATAVRAVVLLTNTCIGYARDHVSRQHGTYATRSAMLERALAAHPDMRVDTLVRVARQPPDTYGETQLQFALDAIVSGIAAVPQSPPRPV